MNTLPKLDDHTYNLFKTASVNHTMDYSSYHFDGQEFIVAGWDVEASNLIAARLFEATHTANVKAVGICRNDKHVAARIKSTNPDSVRECREEIGRLFGGMLTDVSVIP